MSICRKRLRRWTEWWRYPGNSNKVRDYVIIPLVAAPVAYIVAGCQVYLVRYVL